MLCTRLTRKHLSESENDSCQPDIWPANNRVTTSSRSATVLARIRGSGSVNSSEERTKNMNDVNVHIFKPDEKRNISFLDVTPIPLQVVVY